MMSIQNVDKIILDMGIFDYGKAYVQDMSWCIHSPVVFVPHLGMTKRMLGESPSSVLTEGRWSICPEGMPALRNHRGVRDFSAHRDDWVSEVSSEVASLASSLSYSFRRKVAREYGGLSWGALVEYSEVIRVLISLVRKEFLVSMCMGIVEGFDYEGLDYPAEVQAIIECMKSGCLPVGFKGRSLVVVVPNREEIAKEWRRAKSEALAAGEDLSPYGITE